MTVALGEGSFWTVEVLDIFLRIYSARFSVAEFVQSDLSYNRSVFFWAHLAQVSKL